MAAALVVARLLLPNDANPSGNVHGGTTLRLMEEAGMIAAARHMSSKASFGEGGGLTALIRFENMAFHKPTFVGEVASCVCEIIFTSKQSILVEVVVRAEDISTGKTRGTNTGWLWYVPMVPRVVGRNGEKKEWKITSTVEIAVPGDEAAVKKYEKAKAMYEKRKSFTQNIDEGFDEKEFETFKNHYTVSTEGRSPKESEQLLCQMVLPGDCMGKVAFGGFVMKLMDNAAGCSAWRHCRTNVVTVAISDVDFVKCISLGNLCTIRSKVVFASSKSLEIEIVASVASDTGGDDTVAAKGLFTFVSIGSDGKVLPVPELRLESEEDKRCAYLGKLRYEAAKKARSGGAK